MRTEQTSKFAGKNLIIGLFIGLFLMIGISFGQGGANSPQNENSNNRTDQTDRSMAHVNPSTLAMEMSIPFISYPGRNGNSVAVGVSYSSKLWRMRTGYSYFYTIEPSGYRQYVTHLNPEYAELSAAGWTSTLSPPTIEEKTDIYDQLGNPFTFGGDLVMLNALFSNIVNPPTNNAPGQHQGQCEECNYNFGFCSVSCTSCSGYCYDWCQYTNSCGGGGTSTGGGGNPTSSPSPSPTGSPSPTPTPTPTPFPSPSPIPTPNFPGPIEPADTMRYVKRVKVRIGNGSVVEFRKSDEVFSYCAGESPNNGPNCEPIMPDNYGNYLSVDGSGMRLYRDLDGSTLYMPDGGRYKFSSTNNGGYDGSILYKATAYIDKDGNTTRFSANKTTDTLNREITDFIPSNFNRQAQTEGIQTVNLKGLNEGTQTYQLKWLKLKPDEGGIQEGALEDQSQSLYYFTKNICEGNNYGNPLPATEVLFKLHGIGLRSCNPSTRVNNVATALRFNPVVLAEIVLPNNQKYEFKYNQYGEISKIIYPSGSMEKFEYDLIMPLSGLNSPAYDQTNRGVKVREVFDKDGLLQQRWLYNADLTSNGYKVTTIASKGDSPTQTGIVTERYLFSNQSNEEFFGFGNVLDGMPKQEIVRDENGQIRSRSLTEYKVKSTSTTLTEAQRDARPQRTVSVMIEGGQALATLSETEYDEPGTNGYTVEGQTDPAYFSHLNVKRKKAYHYAVVPLSVAQTGTLSQIASYFNSTLLSNTAETDYQYDTNYKARGISSLPTESRVYDRNGNVITRSRTEYDQSNYLNGESGTLSSSLANTWINPATDESIPINSRSNRGKPTTSKVWDDDNNRWISTHTTYDQYGNPRKVWEAVADPETPSRFVETQYDDPNNNSCGGNPCPQSYAYPTKVITPGPGDGTHGTNLGSQASTTYDYTTGLPLTATNEFGQTTATEYNDPLLRPTRSYAVNFAAPESQTIYDDNALTVKVRKQIDEQNWDEATTFSDSLGRTFKTQAKDSQGDVFVETKYDLLGRPVAVTNPYRQGDTVYWSKTRYDEMGRAVEAFAPANFNTTGDSLGITEYGISSQTGFVGTVVTKTDASGRKSRSFTNALGQLTRVDEPGSNNQLDAVPQTTPTPNPSPTPPPTYPVDPPSCAANCPNNLTGSEYPMHSTYYEYNVQGKMVKVTQGVQVRYFMYDSLGRLIRVKQPEQEVNDALDKSDPSTGNGKWTARMTYDLFGNVLTTTDAKGVTITTTYDKANRVLTKVFSGEPQGQTTPPVEYFYDGYGLDTAPPATNNYAKGKLTKVTSSISETRYTKFDEFGRLTESEQRTPFGSETVANATPQVSKYKYDFGGRLIEETYPSGRVVKNTFEADGDLSAISSKAGTQVGFKTFASNFTTTASGLIDKLQIGSGRWEAAKFNERNQIKELALGTSPSDTSLWKLNYEYGELESNGTVNTSKNTGNIAKQTISYGGLTNPFVQTYKYDSLYRITEAKEMNGTTQTWNQNWSYDRYGNRIGFAQNLDGNQLQLNQQTLPSVDPNTNRFTDASYHYDKAGNLVNDPKNNGRVFTFNGDNKQTEVRDSSIIPSPSNPDANLIGRYYYDGEGKRVKKVTATEITVFVYSSGKLVAEYSTELPPNPTTNYVATDTLQSVRAISDKNGNIISRRDFMPFGEELYANTANRTTSAKYSAVGDDGIRQKFTGYEKDKETGLDFAEARYYNNAHGRFTAVDPLLASGKSANPQTFNRYVYTMNCPTLLTDPSGLCTGINCPANYYGTVYTKTDKQGNVKYNNVKPDDSWTVFEGEDTFVRGDASKLKTHVNKYGWYEVPEPSNVQRLLAGFPANPWEQAATGTAKGVGNFFISAANTATFLANNNGRIIPTFDNPFAIERYSLNTQIERNFGYGTEGALWVAGPVAAAPFRAGSALSVVPEATTPLRFSQITASPNFSSEGAFTGKTIGQIATDLRAGTLKPSQVPVEFVSRDGVNLIVNTRSSLALRRANIPPSQWSLINRTGNPFTETNITNRLLKNNLTNQGTDVLRITGCGKLCSSLQ